MEENHTPSSVIAFGPFVFHPSTGQLARDDVPVPLRPKATEILRCLLQARGQLVTRDDLIQCAWPNTTLEADQALHTAVRQIRRALGDSAAEPRYIETVHRRGYRFKPAPVQHRHSRKAYIRRGTMAVLVASIGAVWVTGSHFANTTSLPDTPEVIQAAYLVSRGGTGDVREAASLLEPLVSEGNNSARVWSTLAAAYSRLDKHDDATRTAQRALELDGRSSESHRVLAESAMWAARDWQAAERHFLTALDLDPNNARAHSGYAFYLLLTHATNDAVREMRRAMTLEPLSALINGDAAWVFYWAGLYDEAERQALRTLDIEPAYTASLEVVRLTRRLRGDDSGARAAAVRLLRAANTSDSVVSLVNNGLPTAGLQAFIEWRVEMTSRRLAATKPNTWVWYGLALAEQGHTAESEAAFARAQNLHAPMWSLVMLDPRITNNDD